MSDILYSKLRLEVPQVLDGENATITSSRGATRTVEMSSPITDIMLAGMEKYRVQAGITDESVSFGYGEIKKKEILIRHLLKKIPTAFDGTYGVAMGDAVVFNNEIHILKSTNHWKFDGNNWVSVSTIPYDFSYGKAVVYNNEIHILGGFNGFGTDYSRYHYKWNGSSWSSVSTLPYIFSGSGNSNKGSAVVLNNEIHILGSGYTGNTNYLKYHYKWNGSSWSSVSTLPVNVNNGYNAFIRNGYLELIVGSSHRRWNGSSWSSVSTLPYNYSDGAIVVLNDEIHILGGGSDYDGLYLRHYKYNGSTWVSVSTLPFKFRYGGEAVTWNSGMPKEEVNSNEIVIMSPWQNPLEVAQWDGTSWTVGTD